MRTYTYGIKISKSMHANKCLAEYSKRIYFFILAIRKKQIFINYK